MREDVLQFITNNKELKKFIRENPSWYRKLTREPENREELELAAMQYFRKTIPHKIEKFSNSLDIANMFIHMYQSMKTEE